MVYQLDFLAEEFSELDAFEAELRKVKESNDKVRKSLFAKHADLARKYVELHERLQILERNICRPN